MSTTQRFIVHRPIVGLVDAGTHLETNVSDTAWRYCPSCGMAQVVDWLSCPYCRETLTVLGPYGADTTMIAKVVNRLRDERLAALTTTDESRMTVPQAS